MRHTAKIYPADILIGRILIKFKEYPFTGRDALIGNGGDGNKMCHQNYQNPVRRLLRDEFAERFQIGLAILPQLIE